MYVTVLGLSVQIRPSYLGVQLCDSASISGRLIGGVQALLHCQHGRDQTLK